MDSSRPKFWKDIFHAMQIEKCTEMESIQDLLTSLGYISLKSIVEIGKKNTLEIEIEFNKISSKPEISLKYPSLTGFIFGSGTHFVLKEIIQAAKTCFIKQSVIVDVENVRRKLLSEIRKKVIIKNISEKEFDFI